MIRDYVAGVNFRQPRGRGVTQREREEALRMIRQRASCGIRTTEKTLGAALGWRPKHAEMVSISLINHGFAEDVDGYLVPTLRGLEALK